MRPYLINSNYRTSFILNAFLLTFLVLKSFPASVFAEEKIPQSQPKKILLPKRLLLIGQSPDNHPWGTHEYTAGMRILAQCLQPVKQLQIILTSADEPWTGGPELIQSAEGIVLFVSQGAKWIQKSPKRLQAFQDHVKQGKALTVIHWGMGCKDAKYINEFKNLFGGCHGGPDRKYKYLTTNVKPIQKNHLITEGVNELEIEDEFYYELKFANHGNLIPLISAKIDEIDYTVGWGWERPEGGRSFGFSGLHHHINWNNPNYRKLITQGVLWTLKLSDKQKNLPLKFSENDLIKPRPKPKKK